MKQIGIKIILVIVLVSLSSSVNALTFDEIVAGQTGGRVLGDNTGMQLTLTKSGLQKLTYNGQPYLTATPSNGPIVGSAYFKTPEGVSKSYGWTSDTLGHDDFYFSNASSSVSTNLDSFQHIYHPGKTDSLTLTIGFTPTDSRTLKVNITVKNNDSVDSLTQINLDYFFQLLLPGPANQYQNNIPIVLGVFGQNSKPAQFWSGTWGSVAMWPDNYNNHTWFNMWYQSAGQTQFDPIIGKSKSDPEIAPGQSWSYSFNVRFGSVLDTINSLAPESFENVRTLFPYMLNWPDRRPIARAFIAEGTKRSVLNPRGYLNDPLLNVASSTLFSKAMLASAERTLANMNAMDPKPQGLMVWDLEGQEFNHAFTYIGYPSKLTDMAPEMDAVADAYFKKFTDAGYKIGMTLRPSEFGSGSVLPSTCHHDANYELSDKFIKTNAAFPNRSFLCTATNTWTQDTSGGGLGVQVTLTDDSAILNNLRSKVSYARNRWGAKIFYVDSTVYPGGTPINFEIWRTLQREFTDTLFFPENEATMYFGSSAPFNQANMGVFETSSGAKNIYSEAFSVIQATDGINYSDPATYNRALASIKDGNIYMVDGWYASSQNTQILKVYRDAATGASSLQVTPVIILPISADLNKDGVVNSLDYSLISRKWNLTTNISTVDINQDGKIDSLDFEIIKTQWLKSGD